MSDERQDGVVGAFAEIQRRSLDAAAALVERLVSTVDGEPAQPTDDDAADAEGPAAGGAVEDLMAEWARLWRDSLTSLAGVVIDGNGVRRAAAPGIDVGAPPASAPLQLVCSAGEAPAGIEVWLHNPTGEDRSGLRVRVTAPTAHDGSALPDAAVTAVPELLDLPARSGRGVQLTVDPGSATPGTYRGLVLVEGLPDEWLPLEVQVRAGEPTGS